jgi:hypothetical protein
MQNVNQTLRSKKNSKYSKDPHTVSKKSSVRLSNRHGGQKIELYVRNVGFIPYRKSVSYVFRHFVIGDITASTEGPSLVYYE